MAASLPPVPARISTIASRSSFSSGGNNTILLVRASTENAVFQIPDLIVGHGRNLYIARGGELAIVVQLLARGFELVPAFEQLFNAGMLAHKLTRALAIFEQFGIGNLALELLEALALALN